MMEKIERNHEHMKIALYYLNSIAKEETVDDKRREYWEALAYLVRKDIERYQEENNLIDYTI